MWCPFPFWLFFKKESKERKAEKESFKIQFKKNLDKILPIFHGEFGYLPEFEVDYLSEFQKKSMKEPQEVAMSFSFSSLKYYLLYDHDFFKALPSWGSCLYGISHEILHFYQLNVLREKNPGIFVSSLSLSSVSNYQKWMEGLGELYNLKILHDFYINFERLNLSLGLGEICDKKDIKKELIKALSYYRALRDLLDDKFRNEQLILPFELDAEIELDSKCPWPARIEKFKYMQPYLEGMIILGKLIQKRGVSLKDILSQPLTDYQMDKLKSEL